MPWSLRSLGCLCLGLDLGLEVVSKSVIPPDDDQALAPSQAAVLSSAEVTCCTRTVR